MISVKIITIRCVILPKSADLIYALLRIMMLEYMKSTNLFFLLLSHSNASTLSNDFDTSIWSQNLQPFFLGVSEFKEVSCNNKYVGFLLTWMTYHVCLTLGSRSCMVTFWHTVWKLNQNKTLKDCVSVQENREGTCKWQKNNIVLIWANPLCYTIW
jgi:hypothetical protein